MFLSPQLGAESPVPAQMCSRAGVLANRQHVVTECVPCWRGQVQAACARLRGALPFVRGSDAGGALGGSCSGGSVVFSGAAKCRMAPGQRLQVL